jgi:spore germination protein KB
MVVLLLSMMVAENLPEHLKEGLDIIPMYLHLPFQVIVPFLLLLIAYVRKKSKREKA